MHPTPVPWSRRGSSRRGHRHLRAASSRPSRAASNRKFPALLSVLPPVLVYPSTVRIAQVESPGPMGGAGHRRGTRPARSRPQGPAKPPYAFLNLPGFVMSPRNLTEWHRVLGNASAIWTWRPPCGAGKRLKSTSGGAMRYAHAREPDGGDRFRRGLRTFRGVPRRSTLVNNAATHSCQRRQLRSSCLTAADL